MGSVKIWQLDFLCPTMSNTLTRSLAAGLFLLSTTSAVHAQLYKWVDAQGKTHYADKADGAGKAKVKELALDVAPATPSKSGTVPDWQKQEEAYRKRQEQHADTARMPHGPSLPARQEGYRSGKLETDANRCRLARDVLSGAARHSGGAPTDANDRETATRDVSSFCR
jgi:hypothetical protein